MDKKVKSAIRECIVKTLRTCKENYVESLRQELVYKVINTSGWSSEYVERKDLYETFRKVNVQKIVTPTETLFFETYPEYKNSLGVSVEGGTSGFAFLNVIYSIVRGIWERTGTLDETPEIDLYLNDLEYFFDNEEVEVGVVTPLEYLSSNVFLPEIQIGEVVVRRFSDEEISNYLSGNRGGGHFGHGIPIYCAELKCKAKKIFKATNSEEFNYAVKKLEFVLDAFRTFKSGRIGRGTIFFIYKRFVPLVGHASFLNVRTLNWSGLALKSEELNDFRAHCEYLMSVTSGPLNIAIRRLSSSEVGRDDYDSFLDAMIGLEALLVSDGGTEIRFRFSIRFASLFDDPAERLENFNLAKELYDLRSKVVHGDIVENSYKNKPMSWWAATSRSKLRVLVKLFIRNGRLPYEEDEKYWDKKILRIQ